MSATEKKEYPVVLSDHFVARLKREPLNETAGSVDLNKNNRLGFSIRYSVPPDSLKTDVNALNLRKTARGEFVVEDAGVAAPSQGTDQGKTPAPRSSSPGSNGPGSSGTTSGSASNASFRGTATATKDKECVLVYNKESGKYELHLLAMDIQVSPVLKARVRSVGATSGSSPSTGSASSSSLPTSKNTSPVKNGSAAPPAARTVSGSLISKRTKKAKPPTRRKLPPSVATLVRRKFEEENGTSINGTVSSAVLGSATGSRVNSKTVTPDYKVADLRSITAEVSTPGYSPSTTPQTKLVDPPLGTPQPNTPPDSTSDVLFDANFDESFKELADELADELGDDDDAEMPEASEYVGTAGKSRSHDDDDDVSEEE